MMEAEQIAKGAGVLVQVLSQAEYDRDEGNIPRADFLDVIAAHITDLEAQLAARDAEIAAWLRRGGVYQHPGPATIAAHERLATAIEAGSYRKETP